MPTLAALFKMLLKLNCILKSSVLLSRSSSFPFVLLEGETHEVQYRKSVVLFSCPSLRLVWIE